MAPRTPHPGVPLILPTYVVCRYSPAGNYDTSAEFAANVLPCDGTCKTVRGRSFSRPFVVACASASSCATTAARRTSCGIAACCHDTALCIARAPPLSCRQRQVSYVAGSMLGRRSLQETAVQTKNGEGVRYMVSASSAAGSSAADIVA